MQKNKKKAKRAKGIKEYAHSDQFVLRKIDTYSPLSRQEERELIGRWQSNRKDTAALRLLFQRNQRLCAKEAFKNLNKGLEFCELMQEANIGMFKALCRFKLEQGTKFSTYATWWIKEGIDRAIKNKARMIRIPVNAQQKSASIQKTYGQGMLSEEQTLLNSQQLAERCNMSREDVERHRFYLSSHISLDKPLSEFDSISMGDILFDREELQPQVLVEDSLDYQKLREWVQSLDSEESNFIHKMYGLVDNVPRTRPQMAELFETTEAEIYRREKKIIEKLRSIATRSEINGTYIEKTKKAKPQPKHGTLI